MNYNIDTFKLKLEKILITLGELENKDLISKGLFSSYFVKLFNELPKDDNLLDIAKKGENAKSKEEQDLLVNDIRQYYLSNSNLDLNTVFEKVQRETLQSFVSELQGDLPQEKVEELNKIISE